MRNHFGGILVASLVAVSFMSSSIQVETKNRGKPNIILFRNQLGSTHDDETGGAEIAA